MTQRRVNVRLSTMWRASPFILGALAFGFFCVAGTASGASRNRARTAVLTVDTNTTFNFLPPAPKATEVEKETPPATNSPVRLKRLSQDDAPTREQVLQTVGGKPGEKEADQAQRPSRQRDLAATEERQKIISAIPLLPAETPQEEKKEKTLWITAKPAQDSVHEVAAPRTSSDAWILQPSPNRAAWVASPDEAPFDRARPSAPSREKPERIGSPFDLGSALRPAPNENVESRGILSSAPLELPLFGDGRNANKAAAAPPRSLPSVAITPPPAVVSKPPPVPSNPFSDVEFARDSPFAPRPVTALPSVGVAAAAGKSSDFAPRPIFASPPLKEANPPPKRSREEIVSEKWEKYFQERKRGF